MRNPRLALLAALVVSYGGTASCSTRPPPDPAALKHAVALLEQPRFQAPPGWRWASLVNGDGAHLRYGWVEPTMPLRGVVVLAPSVQMPAEVWFELARNLSQAGFAVWMEDRRGQGGSDRWPGAGQRAHLEGGVREVRDLRQFSELALAHYPGKAAFLVGESLGGMVGFRLVHDSPGLFTAAAFSAPGIEFQTGGVPRPLLKGLVSTACAVGDCSGYAPTQHDWVFGGTTGAPSDPVRDDPERAAAEDGLFQAHPELREGGVTNEFVKTLFEEARTEQAPGWPEAIHTPLLFGYTPTDRVARADVIQSVCHRIASCTLAAYTSTGHALFTDADAVRGPWIRRLETFLIRWSQPSAGTAALH